MKKTIDPKVALKGKSYVSGEEYKKMLDTVTETEEEGDFTTLTFSLPKILRAEFKAKTAGQQIMMKDALCSLIKSYVDGKIQIPTAQE